MLGYTKVQVHDAMKRLFDVEFSSREVIDGEDS